ncbi:MAG: VOC family protein [Aestuariibacter sp.]
MNSQFKLFRNFIYCQLLLTIFTVGAFDLETAKVSYSKLEVKQDSTSMIVDDVMRTARFYQNTLGFKVTAFQASEDVKSQKSDTLPTTEMPHSVTLQLNGFNIRFIQKFIDPDAKPTFKTVEQLEGEETLRIQVKDLAVSYQQLKNKVTLVQGIHINSNGVETFHIRDCNDYIIGFVSS